MCTIQVSVIIVNYNTRKLTQDCIESVIKYTKDLNYEIILVDNKSTDDSKLYFEDDTRIRYFYCFENMGFGRANNIGMILAKGEYVFLLNSDTLLENNAIKLFYDFATNNNEKLSFYGCWLKDRAHNLIHSFGDAPTMSNQLLSALRFYKRAFHRTSPDHFRNLYNQTEDCFEVGYVTGADLFFHRMIFEKYEAFDHNFFMYFEESEMQFRMKKYGIKSYIIKGPSILHLCNEQGGKPRKVRSIRVKLMNWTSQKYLIKKHYNKVLYFAFRIAYFILMFFPILFDNRYYSLKDRLKYICALAS